MKGRKGMNKNLSKWTKTIAVFVLVLLATVCVGKGSIAVQAAYVGTVTSLTQTDAQKTSLSVSWETAQNAVSYNVYCKDYAGDEEYQFIGTTTASNYTISNLKPATKYYVKIEASNGTDTGAGRTLYDAVTLPDKMSGLRQEQWWYWIKVLDVKWDRQSAADGYEVILYDNNGKKVKKQTISGYGSSGTSFNKMKEKVYTVKARSYMTYKGQKYYSEWGKICCLNQARIKKINVKNNKINVTWGKIAGATGYRVYVSTSPKKGYKKVATLSKNKSSYSIKKFKGKKISSKKTYYVYIETVCNKKGSKNSSGGLYCWNSKTGATGYIK